MRDTTLTFTVSYSEVVRALRLLYPEEFLLRQLPSTSGAGVGMQAGGGSLLTITATHKSQGPAEIDLNRAQRVVERDPA